MENASFLQDLAVVVLAAGAAGLLCHQLRQPKVLGYILAGLFLGPHTPPFSFIKDEATIRTLADLGVIFLMFSLGLEFNLRRFRKVGATSGVTAVLDVVVMVWLGYMLGQKLGWSPLESLFLGGVMCDSSTTILAKTLQELGKTRHRFAGVVVGITVIEDVLAVGMIALLTGIAVTGGVQGGLLVARFWGLILFLVTVIFAGLLTVPRFLNYINRRGNDEILVVVVLGICFGVSLIAVRLELSLALGAVLVGAIVSESQAGPRLSGLVDALKYVFSAVFFVAVGLMLDPNMLLRSWGAVLAVTAVIVCGKFVLNMVGSLLTGHDVPTAIRVGAGMAQVGEFAFIIAALGVALGVTGDPVYQVGVGAAIFTTLLNPYLIRGADRMATVVEDNATCRRCTEYFSLYGLWVERIGQQKQNSAVRKAVRRSIGVVMVNCILISAALGIAGYLARGPLKVLPVLTAHPGFLAAGLWGLAMIVCLPLYVATVRKLQALGMIMAEVVVPVNTSASWARTMRGFVANSILAAGSVALLLLTIVLSWAMLHSWQVLALLIVCSIVVALWLWPKLVKIYAHAQVEVMKMLESDTGVDGDKRMKNPVADNTPMELNVQTVVIAKGAAVAGRDLRSIRLRERTGGTVVGITREGRKITNPGPGEHLMIGDEVFFLGDSEQISAVRELLAEKKRSGQVAIKEPEKPA